MEGVVLAGVHSWGECVLESALCRPLFPVAGLPLVSHTLAWLRDGGVKKANICANSETASLYRCLKDGSDHNIILHYYEDRMPRGPAGCIRDAVIDSSADLLVVVEGTMIPRVDLPDLVASHRKSAAALTVVVSETDAAQENGPRLEPVGIYVFSRDVLAHIPDSGYQDIKETLIPRLYAQGEQVATYRVEANAAPRVVNAASYMAVSKWAVEHLAASDQTPPGYVRIREAIIHESARLHASARFVGPVLIGPHTRIDEDALIIGPCTIGADCHIGQQAVVSRSILWSSCNIGAGAILDHCILTDAAKIENELVMRETVCMARPQRHQWSHRVSCFLGRTGQKSRTVTYVPAAAPAVPPAGRKTAAPTAKPDAKRPTTSPAGS